jgi:hypothetical protein
VLLGWVSLYGLRPQMIGVRVTRYPTGVHMIRRVRTHLLDPRLWIAFLVHDLGYWGKPNMDGAEGETHPEVGARLMRRWFGEPWWLLCLYHSRFYAKRDGASPSVLCYADKVAYLKYPTWLIVVLVTLTGERHEYMKNFRRDNGVLVVDGVRNVVGETPPTTTEWVRGVKTFVRGWVAQHKDGTPDTTTPIREHA